MVVTQKSQRTQAKRENLTFNVDVCARKRQDLKYRFHLVPLACTVEEGLSFGQDTQRTSTPKTRQGREERTQKLGCARCPAHCPLLYDEQTNKISLRCAKTPRKEKKKSSDLKRQPTNEDTISEE